MKYRNVVAAAAFVLLASSPGLFAQGFPSPCPNDTCGPTGTNVLLCVPRSTGDQEVCVPPFVAILYVNNLGAECGPCSVEKFPGAGFDFLDTTANLIIDLPGLGSTSVNVAGPTIVHRSAPRRDSGSGRNLVATEIVSMSLSGSAGTGFLATLKAGKDFGSPETRGKIEQLSSGDVFPASARFDLYLSIEVRDATGTLVSSLDNLDPYRIVAVPDVNEIPLDEASFVAVGPPGEDPPFGGDFHWSIPNGPDPEPPDCDENEGQCLGGPCAETDFQGNELDPFGPYHPDGNYDKERYCEDFGPQNIVSNSRMVCIDKQGVGICKKCSAVDGEFNTKVGCPCSDEQDCESFNAGEAGLECVGGAFDTGGDPSGFCAHPNDGPPSFQCDEGTCAGLSDPYDGTPYFCFHDTDDINEAQCVPWGCLGGDPIAVNCANQGLVCSGETGDCEVQCFNAADCTDNGWPFGTSCFGNQCVFP